MSRACCVPGCKSNYRSTLKSQPRKSAFGFPKDEELRKKWIQAIPRKHWAPNKNSVICEDHFSPTEIVTEDFVIDERGEKIVLRELKKPYIEEGAVPHIFPNLPSYLSTPKPSTSTRTDPEDRRKTVKKREDKQIQDSLEKDIIHCYSDFQSGVHGKVSGCWTVVVKNHETHLYIVDGDGESPQGLTVQASVIVNSNLEVTVYVKGCRQSHHQLGCVLSKNNVLNRWSQLEALLQVSLSSIVDSDLDFKFFIGLAITCLFKALSVASESLQNRATLLNFIIEQLQYVISAQPRYSASTFLFAFDLMNSCSKTYEYILSKVFILPCVRYLKQICSESDISPVKDFSNFNYLGKTASGFSQQEKVVNLLIDEIYVRGSMEYKSGSMTGYAENNSRNLARTVQTFMISSAFGNKREVVRLWPVYNISGLKLYQEVVKLLEIIHSFGFKILSVITDNNRVNQNLFNYFRKKDKCQHYFKSSVPGEKHFFLYDSVHIFKNIRNNWLNLKDSENMAYAVRDRTFSFPDFENDNIYYKACWQNLKDFHYSESNKLVKKAPKLNSKSLEPNNLERQNVRLVNNVFHDTTIAALKSSDHRDYINTSIFLTIIKYWWDIVNSKNVLSGKLLRKDMCRPIYTIFDDQVRYLEQFLDWLCRWEHHPMSVCLTKDTMNAIQHTTATLLQIIEYCFLHFDFVEYVLLGKFQTDYLEQRFSRYRFMSGCNFNVSFRKICESEKKIRLQHLLRFRDISVFKSLKVNKDDHHVVEGFASDKLKLVLNLGYLQVLDLDESVRVYICGYVAKSLHSKFKCPLCLNLYESTESASISDKYFKDLQRGGLHIPTDEIMFLYYHMLAILQFILSNREFDKEFLEGGSHKHVLIELTLYSINRDATFINMKSTCTRCKVPYQKIYLSACNILANILLNNYTKLKTDTDPISYLRRYKYSTLQSM